LSWPSAREPAVVFAPGVFFPERLLPVAGSFDFVPYFSRYFFDAMGPTSYLSACRPYRVVKIFPPDSANAEPRPESTRKATLAPIGPPQFDANFSPANIGIAIAPVVCAARLVGQKVVCY